MQYGPILAVLNTTKTNTRIRIFTQELSLDITTQVLSYSILTIQLLVVSSTFVRWPTTVTTKALTSRQKEKPHGKKNNLTAKRKTSQQKEKPHGKKKNLTAKRNTHGKHNNLKAKLKKKTHGKKE